MFTKITGESMKENYDLMAASVKLLLDDERDLIANLSNISAIINAYMDEINWVGFYLMKEGELVLGPFQGLPACIRIPVGKGVCGKAAQTGETQVVEDVHQFPGHIACDSASNSEVVVPLFKGGEVFGVLDVDSPKVGRFGELEVQALSVIGEYVSEYLNV